MATRTKEPKVEPNPPVEEEEGIPYHDDPLAQTIIQRIAKGVSAIQSLTSIILTNTRSEEGIRHIMDSSEDEEIASLRERREANKAEIKRMQEEIDKLSKENSRLYNAQYEKANSILLKEINSETRTQAETDRRGIQQKVRGYVSLLDDYMTPEIQEWLSDIKPEYDLFGQPRGSTITRNGLTSEQRQWNSQAREWAVLTGWINPDTGDTVAPKGRLPKSLARDYHQAHPEVEYPGDPKPWED